MITRRNTLLLPAAFAGAAAAPVRAAETVDGPYRWRNAVVGAGGFAPGIVFSPAARGLAYLRTDMGGAYRWEDADGGWTPLQDGMADGNMFGIESIAPDPRDADLVYMAAGAYRREPAAMLRSVDRGRSWAVFPVAFRMGGNEDGRGLGERLAIDPHRPSTLFFGSRHDGLQVSRDRGETWAKVASFPWAGLGLSIESRGRTHAGVAFVVFDMRRGSRTMWAGVADPGGPGLCRSEDGGATWAAVSGGPGDLLPVKAAADGAGRLLVTYANGIGPNGVTRGAVWRLDDGRWQDLTPDDRSDAPEGGYMGVAIDRARPGHLLVTSINRWKPGDTVWRSTDDGRTWEDLRARSVRDVSLSPFLKQEGDGAEFGHWTAGLALDPFDGRRASYTTGATVYVTDDVTTTGPIRWRPWVHGIEQTAIISLASPGAGAPLVSGFGDIAGFVHDDLGVSPARMHLHPHLTNTNNLDWAGLRPEILVRSGNRHANQAVEAAHAWSDDGGHCWTPIRTAMPREQAERAHIVTGADGATFIVAAPAPILTRDRGATWAVVRGLPANGRPVADKADPRRFYALDFDRGRFLVSADGGAGFAPVPTSGLPADLSPARPRNREVPFPLVAEPGRTGHLWLKIGPDVHHSTDGGLHWTRTGREVRVDLFAIGKGAPGAPAPALYVAGEHRGVRGLFRSVDGGESWTRIDDDRHRWGHRYRVIEGDPKRFGRLYVGTDGRGVIYGDPV